MEGVTGSIPVSSTLPHVFALVGHALAGFVAGEGCFSVTIKGRRRFLFAVDVSTRDRPMLEALRAFLGVGSIYDQPSRRRVWQPMSQLRVKSLRSHDAVTLPFGAAFMLPCAKRHQLEAWAAQLGTLLPATGAPPAAAMSAFLGGFTAAEGSFIASPDGRRFTFSVGVGAVDDGMCQLFRRHLGVGRVQLSARRAPHFDDEAAFIVGSLRDLVDIVVPFMDVYLPPSHKRHQYLGWRARLVSYWERDARRVRECGEAGCTQPRRARGLCRRHYYERYRR